MGAAKRAPMSPYAHFSHQHETTNVRAHFPLCPTDRKLCKVRWSGRGSLGTDPVSGAATSRGAEKVSLFPWAAVPDTPNVPWAYSLPGVPGKSRGELQRGRETTRWADLAPWHPGTSALVQIRHEPPAAAPLCGLSHACGHRVALRRMTVPSFAGSRALPFRRSRALVTGFFWCCTLRKEARLADRMQEWGGTGGLFGAGLRPSRYVQ